MTITTTTRRATRKSAPPAPAPDAPPAAALPTVAEYRAALSVIAAALPGAAKGASGKPAPFNGSALAGAVATVCRAATAPGDVSGYTVSWGGATVTPRLALGILIGARGVLPTASAAKRAFAKGA